jgi:hypothetical protein
LQNHKFLANRNNFGFAVQKNRSNSFTALVKVSKHSIIQTISEAFPDADEDYLGECFERVKASSVDPVEAISNMLLEDNKYPKKKKEAKSPEKAAFIDIEASDLAAEADVNYFDLKTEPNDEYKIQWYA